MNISFDFYKLKSGTDSGQNPAYEVLGISGVVKYSVKIIHNSRLCDNLFKIRTNVRHGN